jgi:GT2 family glycosyltransferase
MAGTIPSEQAPRASVIIVNWNGRDYLPACLESLQVQSYVDFETIVVDNGSHDESLELLRNSYPWVRLVELAVNSGFATGNNAGLAVARGTDYIIALNNDTRVEPTWLAELISAAEGGERVGMVGCRICSWDEPDLLDSLGVAICRDGMSRGRLRQVSFSSLSLQKTEEILLPSGCAALYRRAMVDEIGFFDDDFFAYCEDTDLGLRGRLAGWRAVLARDAVVHHRYSRSGGVFSPLKLYLVERNHFWLALKCFPLALLIQLPFWTVARYLVQARLVFGARGAGAQFRSSSQGGLVQALIKALRDTVLSVPVMLHKRRSIMNKRRLSAAEMRRLLNKYAISFDELLDAG